MSQEEAEQKVLTGKAKKAKRSEERHKKNKKSKPEVSDLPAGADEQTEDSKATKSDTSSSKKRKRPEDEQEATKATTEDGATAETKKPKKRRKGKSQPAAEGAAAAAAAEGSKAEGEEGAAAVPKNQRFIVFIGNLPFTATTEGITEHFASIQPASIRHLTEPGTKKSKGYAFLEFANYDRMKTCLKLFHHSEFDSGVGGERGKRKINVELTAGGGGKSGFRQEKLKAKNVKLDEERKRRAEAQAKEEKRKAKKDAAKRGGKKEDEVEDLPVEESQEGIHPARLAMLNRGGR